MRARVTSLLLATAWVAGVGCASKPAEKSSAAEELACASSRSASQADDHDTSIDSILTQPTSDPRLTLINRRMYQSLRALDAELRREQRLAACQSHPLGSAVVQAQTDNKPEAGGGAPVAGETGVSAGTAVGGAAHASAESVIGTTAIASSLPVSSSVAGASGTGARDATAPYANSMRKASVSSGRGGNGATTPKRIPGNDDDVVARRLRKAAEQETNPSLRAKLWKEYTDYRQGTSTK